MVHKKLIVEQKQIELDLKRIHNISQPRQKKATWVGLIHKHDEVFNLDNFKHFKRNEHKMAERIAKRRRIAQGGSDSPSGASSPVA